MQDKTDKTTSEDNLANALDLIAESNKQGREYAEKKRKEKIANVVTKDEDEDVPLSYPKVDNAKLREYVSELVAEIEKKESKSGNRMTKDQISQIKNNLAKKYKLLKPPRDMDVMLCATKEELEKIRHLKSKPTRSLSGVAVVAVMTKPMMCPHGKCVFCPGGLKSNYGDVPQSYTGFEPSTRRAIRNNYDPFLIVFNRLEQYVLGGHNPNKVDCIIMGGTFSSYPYDYQIEVATRIYAAMNCFAELFYSRIDSNDPYELNMAKFKEFFELPHTPDDPDISPRVMQRMKDMASSYMMRFDHLSVASRKDLGIELLKTMQRINEHSAIRCVGLTQETRPDCSTIDYANRMLELGTTRIEIGCQSIFDEVLIKSGRGHSVKDVINATRVMRDLGFKIVYHMMIGMPGSDINRDRASLTKIFEDENFKPDMLKIYPLLVMPGTKLHDDYREGKYVPYKLSDAVKLLAECIAKVPRYCRIMRIQRDIPSTMVAGGITKTNLKQYVDSYMVENNLISQDIRSREIARSRNTVKHRVINADDADPNFEINVLEYDAGGGKEFFISVDDKKTDTLLGFCRLRLIGEIKRPEFDRNSAIIRELHVYGSALNISGEASYAELSGQHKGFGKKLVARAEEIAKSHGKKKVLVISGIGVKEYYRKLGYNDDGPYVSKKL